MKAKHYALFKLEEKTTRSFKTIKTTLSTVQKKNSPWVSDEEN